MILDPRTRVVCDGWESSVDRLVRTGWHFEAFYEPHILATKIYVKNPSKYMVGHFVVEDIDRQRRMTATEYSCFMAYNYIYFGGEEILLRGEMYKEMQIPNVELQELRVGEPMYPPGYYRGLSEMDESMWRWYTPDDENTSEIIVTPDKVPYLMEKILEAQEPRAKEIIHSQRKRDIQLHTSAKILSFGT